MPSKPKNLPNMKRMSVAFVIILLSILKNQMVTGQLPDDMQRESNQNLAEQARIQAMREQHQNQIKNRQQQAAQSQQPARPAHDPNNYSYQQVSPPIQYSYYQPFGDVGGQQPASSPIQQQQQVAQPRATANQVNNFDFNNLNFDLPQPQAQVSATPAQTSQPALTPSFTGVGGLPVMRPIAGSVPGPLPLPAPQARVQQGPPLSEADFRDITGGENYGAPGGQDFGLGEAGASGNSPRRQDNTDAQLREFGFPGEADSSGRSAQLPGNQQQQQQQLGVPDFGAFGPIGMGAAGQRRSNSPVNDEFGGLEAMSGNLGAPSGTGNMGTQNSRSPSGGDFDFALQPSPSQSQQSRGDQLDPSGQSGGAPGSLQSLLGSGFPGLGSLGGGADNGGLSDGLGGSSAGQQRSDPAGSSMDIADLGEKSDQFSNADLGNFGSQLGGDQQQQQTNPGPSPRNEPDFNFASSNQQPSSVPYPDSAPQPVGSILAITQPQSLTQTRYSALPDQGTYQGYPAYAQSPDSLFASSVNEVIERTPAPRPPGIGRYGRPSYGQLAPEYRHLAARNYDYSYAPVAWYY